MNVENCPTIIANITDQSINKQLQPEPKTLTLQTLSLAPDSS